MPAPRSCRYMLMIILRHALRQMMTFICARELYVACHNIQIQRTSAPLIDFSPRHIFFFSTPLSAIAP